jgi:hypothetical protein
MSGARKEADALTSYVTEEVPLNHRPRDSFQKERIPQ